MEQGNVSCRQGRTVRAMFIRRPREWTIILCAGVLLASALCGATPVPAHAAGPSVTYFYTVSAVDAYPFYHTQNGPPIAPSHTEAFPSDVTYVYFYFSYRNAQPGVTSFQAVLYDDANNVLTSDAVFLANQQAGQYMNSFSNFSNGAYRLVLFVNGAPAMSTMFSVGLLVAITAFDSITETAGHAGLPVDPQTARVAVFPAGTKDICFYVGYEEATPEETQYRVTMYDHSGAVVVKDDLIFPAASGFDNYCFSSTSPFTPGLYWLGLQVDGTTIAITSFTIEQPSIVVTAFYTLVSSGTISASTPAHRFARGTDTIFFYVHFRGVSPSKFHYSLSVDLPTDAQGLSITTGELAWTTDESATSGHTISSISAKRPFPPGVYRLSLLVSNVPVAATNFTVR